MPSKVNIDFDQLPGYPQLVKSICDQDYIQPLGLPRAVRLPLIISLLKDLQRPIVYIIAHSDQIQIIQDEFSFWDENISQKVFAEPPALFYEKMPWGETIRWERINTLTGLAAFWMPGKKNKIKNSLIITTVKALMMRTLPHREFLMGCLDVHQGQRISMDAMLRKVYQAGYESRDIVVEAGQFAHRGGIVDIWVPGNDLPIRIEFFGDEVDTLRSFSPTSQCSVQTVGNIFISPAREVLVRKNVILQEPESSDSLEFYLPIYHPTPATLMDYLPQNALIILDDENYLRTISTEIEEQSLALRQEALAKESIDNDFPIPYLTWSELLDTRSTLAWLDLGFSAEPQEYSLAKCFTPAPRFGGKLETLIASIQRAEFKSHQVYLISRQTPRIKELWQESSSNQFLAIEPLMIEGNLTQGFVVTYPDKKVVEVLTDNEIFGWERPQPRRKVKLVTASPESTYADLKTGDWVVHMDYGIGKFLGLVKCSLEGAEREFLSIQFAENDQLFVPVHQADRLSLYIGPDERPPKITRLGTADWQTTKLRVRGAVRQVAWELLDLYARRQLAKGFSFSHDTTWQKELEASFPYLETEDQGRAIQEVKKDMENERPMDRLLCGDVGYGKTEVALRAAFKAVMDGKQVGMLVPTTILAQQHYETFQQRLSPFPVNLAMLSRFKSPSEQIEIAARLENGEVDIVIGTHRLLQPDIKFKDLGLLIIDEEQRFGVAHKEHFKRLRTEVDVLTLTATPIPRTLYMALSGVRDISVINTPPSDRLPISTYVGSYDPTIVRRSILRELDRQGQVFFVHNRVQTIAGMADQLKRLVPEARIAIGHGQMAESELAEVMHTFNKGKIDVLISTSIIESGLDIPNANTLIVDHGDAFGLAQLYQLRGRVGRGSQRAYAYFFFDHRQAPTIDGRERLEIIAENTQLGAGYSIAMRDLEMRGAGDLLGTLQHGHIAAVGFHLYTRLLSQAVRELRGERKATHSLAMPSLPYKEIRSLVTVELPIPIGIPLDYVSDQDVRLQLYRRLADIQDEREIDQIAEEFEDRFGPTVEEVQNLFYQLKIKLLAERCGLASVSVENDQLVLRYPPLAEGAKIRSLVPLGGNVRAGKNAYWMPFDKINNKWKESLKEILRSLAGEKFGQYA